MSGDELFGSIHQVRDMSVQLFLLYLATWSFVAITPGPAVMCSMAQATRYGLRSSVAGIAGIQLGNALFFVGVGLGVGALLTTASNAFNVLRILGAIYLFYVGIRIILSTISRLPERAPRSATCLPAHRSLFLQGLLIQITNPKALLFVSALLPQFLDPQRPAVVQLGILMFTTMAVDFIVLSLYAFMADRGIQLFRASPVSKWLQRAFGASLLVFGARLLSSRE